MQFSENMTNTNQKMTAKSIRIGAQMLRMRKWWKWSRVKTKSDDEWVWSERPRRNKV